ncbi:MAG: homoaconitate hydratase [Thermoplasmata archaeon]
MAADEVIIYDSTLREGEQMPGVRFTPAQKVDIAQMLIDAKVHQIEAGFAAVSDGERKSIRDVVSLGGDADILSLARARKEDIDAALTCGIDMILIFIATSNLHLEKKLRKSKDEVLEAAVSSIEYAKAHGVMVGFSTEDTTRSDREFLRRIYTAADDAGADRIGITDTVGCSTPESIAELVRFVRTFSKNTLSVHLHNDFGLALANALSAVAAGANAVSTTVCGFGERAGNVPLEQFVMAMKYHYGKDLGIKTEKLTPLARRVSEYAGVEMSPTQPWVGRNAFAHESGIHVAAVLTDPATYEVISPETVGNSRRIVLGKHSGRALISSKLIQRGLTADPEKLDAILKNVKRLGERKGAISEDEFWAIVEETMKG